MEAWQAIISIAGVFIGVLSGLNAIVLAGLRSQMDEYSQENREDHQLLFKELGAKQSIITCENKVRTCNGNRDKKLEIANKADEIIVKDRREVIDEKIKDLTESVHGMGVSLDNLSTCISKYTKGVCP